MNQREALIAGLSRDLSPVPREPNINGIAMLWLLISAFYVVLMIHFFGPIRPGALSQLASSPRFLLEILLGVMAIVWVSLAAFRSAIPGALTKKFAAGGSVLMTLWLAQYPAGFASPAIEPSMLGKRDYCLFETLVYALPPILIALYLIRRLYPLRPLRTAMSVSLAAGMLPALYMQIACMYEPSHILRFHILPGLLMVVVGAMVAMAWRLRRKSVS